MENEEKRIQEGTERQGAQWGDRRGLGAMGGALEGARVRYKRPGAKGEEKPVLYSKTNGAKDWIAQ